MMSTVAQIALGAIVGGPIGYMAGKLKWPAWKALLLSLSMTIAVLILKDL